MFTAEPRDEPGSVVENWERGEDAHRNIPILTEDEELIWSGLGSMSAYLAVEREEAGEDER